MINSSVYTEDDELQLRLNEELLKTLDSKDNIPNSLQLSKKQSKVTMINMPKILEENYS